MRWGGGNDRLVHAVEGQLFPGEHNKDALCWTRCKKYDIPARVSPEDMMSRLRPTCEKCLSIISDEVPQTIGVTRSNPNGWIITIWNALEQHDYEDSEWEEICTAMAWISEELDTDDGCESKEASE